MYSLQSTYYAIESKTNDSDASRKVTIVDAWCDARETVCPSSFPLLLTTGGTDALKLCWSLPHSFY